MKCRELSKLREILCSVMVRVQKSRMITIHNWNPNQIFFWMWFFDLQANVRRSQGLMGRLRYLIYVRCAKNSPRRGQRVLIWGIVVERMVKKRLRVEVWPLCFLSLPLGLILSLLFTPLDLCLLSVPFGPPLGLLSAFHQYPLASHLPLCPSASYQYPSASSPLFSTPWSPLIGQRGITWSQSPPWFLLGILMASSS